MRPQLFLDMDDTFYNWRATLEPIREALRVRRHSDERINEAISKANAQGFSFDRLLQNLNEDERYVREYAREFGLRLGLGSPYLFSNVFQTLWRISQVMDIELLTYGYRPYQRAKWAGLSRLHSLFHATHFVYNDRTKGEVIVASGRSDAPVFFCDDNPEQLMDVRAKAPWCKCVRMRHRSIPSDDHESDGVEWAVVHDMHELLAWLYSELNGAQILWALMDEYDEVHRFINEYCGDLLLSGALPELNASSIARLFDGGQVVVARLQGGQIVGTAMIYYGQTWRKKIGHIEYVAVHPEFRRQGVGAMLICALHGLARGESVRTIRLTCESHRKSAHGLYRGLFEYQRDHGSDEHLIVHLD